MKFHASLSFAYRLLFPRTGKKSNARRSLVGACLCIGISIIPLVVVLSVSDGMIAGITERIIGLSTSHISIRLPYGIDESFSLENLKNFSQKVKELDSVNDVFPEVSGIALASTLNGRTGAYVRGVEDDIFTRNKSFSSLFKVLSGNAGFEGVNSCVIGQKLSEILDVDVGGTVRLITTRENSSGGISPRVTSLKVSGIVSSGYQELDSLWLFIPMEKAFGLLPKVSSDITVGVVTPNAFGVELEKAYYEIDQFIPQYAVPCRWNEINPAQFENFASTQIMLVMIMMLIVLVASVNISSALVMLVMERRREIAILKSLGGTSGGIAMSFLITGVVTGLCGVILGLPLGFLCIVNFNSMISVTEKILNFLKEIFYLAVNGNLQDFTKLHLLDPNFYLQNVEISIPMEEIILIASGTLVLSLIMSIIPAIKAGKEKPIETLRKI